MPNYHSLWEKIDSLIPGLNLYITKKNIQDVAMRLFKTKFEERIKKEAAEKEAAEKEAAVKAVEGAAKKAVEEAAIRDIETNLENQKRKDIEEQIQTTATAAVTNEVMASQIKQYAKYAVSKSVKLVASTPGIEKSIETTATDAVTNELISNQIEEAAIRDIETNLENKKRKDIEEQIQTTATAAVKNGIMVNQIILKLIKLKLPLIRAIIDIKEAAMKAVSKWITPTKTITGIETLIQTTAKDAVTNELISNQIKEAAIRNIKTILENKKRKDIEEQIQTTATAAVKNGIMVNQIILKLIKLKLPLIRAIIDIKEAAMKAVSKWITPTKTITGIETLIQTTAKDAVTNELISNQIKEAAIRDIETNLENQKRKGIEEQIQTTATAAVTNEIMASQIKQSAKDAVSKGITPTKTITDIKASIETTAIDRVTSELISNQIKQAAVKAVSERLKIQPIEESIKTTAINAVNVALSVKPIDSRPLHSKFDVLITDKTYEYDEETRKQKEITHLTKNDTI